MRQADKQDLDAVSIPATTRALQQTSPQDPRDRRLVSDAPVTSLARVRS